MYALNQSTVMAGLDPAIHVFPSAPGPKSWIKSGHDGARGLSRDTRNPIPRIFPGCGTGALPHRRRSML